MEDLPLGRIATLAPEFCSEGPALGQNTDDDDDDLKIDRKRIRWPSRSPDTIPPEFFSVAPEGPVLRTLVHDLADLQERFYAAVNIVTPQMRHNTWVEVEYRLDICYRSYYKQTKVISVLLRPMIASVVSLAYLSSRVPGFDSRLFPRKFSGNILSGMWSIQPREDNWVATSMRSDEILLRKMKLSSGTTLC